MRGSSKDALSVGTARYSRVSGPRSTKGAQWLESAPDDPSDPGFESCCRRFETLRISFTPLRKYLSEETLQSCWSLPSDVYI